MGKGTIGILTGSLRRDSYSKKVALCLSELLGARFSAAFLELSDLPIYNQDLDNETDLPPAWGRLRREVKAADAVLFVTPEYNRSMPPVLKNALDIASRPMTENAWKGKPGAVVSLSPGGIGGFGANHHLRQSAACLGIHMMQQPEAYIGGIAGLVDADGGFDDKTRDFLRTFAAAFEAWIDRLTPQTS
ncbi:MAG: NAD(P)H-dependent oxidoreductase [Oscillospiraceae bacterium]|nr:NAD(P)H-dependent oxidoreductase [Oscillospiraceae bacterium]